MAKVDAPNPEAALAELRGCASTLATCVVRHAVVIGELPSRDDPITVATLSVLDAIENGAAAASAGDARLAARWLIEGRGHR
jgi:hypothetical protein